MLLGKYDIDVDQIIEYRRAVIRQIITSINNTNEAQDKTSVMAFGNKLFNEGTFN